jgi:hypothetical protein
VIKRFSGAVLDGPLFGQNLASDYPNHRVARQNKITSAVVSDLSAVPLDPIPLSYYEYFWDMKIEAWRLKEDKRGGHF